MLELILLFFPAIIGTMLLEYFENKRYSKFLFFKIFSMMAFIINLLIFFTLYMMNLKDLPLKSETIYTVDFCLKYGFCSLMYSILASVLSYIFIKNMKVILKYK